MTDNYALPKFPEILDISEELNKNLMQVSLTLVEKNVECSRKINQEVVTGIGKMVAEINDPEQFTQALVNYVSATGETTKNYFLSSAELLQEAQQETLNIFLGKGEVPSTPKVLEAETVEPKKVPGKAKKATRQVPSS